MCNEVAQRSQLAQLSKLVTAAAADGDQAALGLFSGAACELADLIDAVRGQLAIPGGTGIAVSCSGGMFQAGALLREPLEAQLRRRSSDYRFIEPKLPPEVGAAIQAAKLNGTPLGPQSLKSLQGRRREG